LLEISRAKKYLAQTIRSKFDGEKQSDVEIEERTLPRSHSIPLPLIKTNDLSEIPSENFGYSNREYTAQLQHTRYQRRFPPVKQRSEELANRLHKKAYGEASSPKKGRPNLREKNPKNLRTLFMPIKD